MNQTHTKSNSPVTHPFTGRIPAILLDHEITTLLATALSFNVRDYTMIKLALNTGLRNNELISLTMECVQPYGIITNILELPGSIAKGGHGRNIPLNPDVRACLEAWLETKEYIVERTNPIAYLFVSQFSRKQLSTRDFQRIVKTISSSSIGRSITPHTLRHTFATRLLSRSNIRIVQEVLGHKNIQSTQIYTHPSTNEISDAVSKL